MSRPARGLPATVGRRTGRAAMVGLTAVFLAACSETFTPLAPTELQYSIHGYLDASADTQWIRVMPIRPLILTSPEPLEAAVTIQEMGSGRVITLRDSIFRFQPDPELGSDGAFMHNFWTAEKLRPGERYRLAVARPGLEVAEAEVLLPPAYDVDVLVTRSPFGGGSSSLLIATGIEHLPFAILSTSAYDDCGPRFARNLLETGDPQEEARLIGLNVPLALAPSDQCGEVVIERQDVLLVASGSAWPDGGRFDPNALSVPDGPSNISHSLGFLGGVLTRVIPKEECILEPVSFEGCRLRYGPEMGTLTGEVTDLLCTRAGITWALVEMKELGAPSPEGRRIRPVRTFRGGGYRIGALDAGREYELRVSRPGLVDPYERYHVHTDTLRLAPGEVRRYDVGLRRLDCPPPPA